MWYDSVEVAYGLWIGGGGWDITVLSNRCSLQSDTLVELWPPSSCARRLAFGAGLELFNGRRKFGHSFFLSQFEWHYIQLGGGRDENEGLVEKMVDEFEATAICGQIFVERRLTVAWIWLSYRSLQDIEQAKHQLASQSFNDEDPSTGIINPSQAFISVPINIRMRISNPFVAGWCGIPFRIYFQFDGTSVIYTYPY